MLQRILRTLIILWIVMIPFRFAHAGGSDKTKNLTRTVDPAVVTGDRLPDLAGAPIRRLALYRVTKTGLGLIPFQVDERLADGGYAYAHQNRGKPRPDDGLVDANDELAFMAADTGDRFDAQPWPPGAVKSVEIALTDPDDGGVGYAYLFAFDEDAPDCDADYVVYHVDLNEIETLDYLIGYDPKAQISLGKVIVKPAFGGTGVSVADRLKIRISATVALNLFRIERTEEDFKTKIIAYTDGPVRVIRQTRAWQTLFWDIPSPASYMTTVYYRNQMRFPITIDVPFDVSMFFRDVSMRVSVDTPHDVPGQRRYYNDANRAGVTFDGRMSDAEAKLDRRPFTWQVVAGTDQRHPEGWFSRQKVISEKAVPISLPLYYADDLDRPDPPENYPGSFGNLGFEFQGIDMLKKGALRIEVQQYPLLNYAPGDEDTYLKVDDRPLTIRTRPLAR